MSDQLIDLLETRRLLAAFATLNSRGTLSVTGNNNDNQIDVSIEGNRIAAKRDGQTLRFNRNAVKRIFIGGGNGHDRLLNRTDKPATIHGGAGNDELTGGNNAATLNGGRGADRLLAALRNNDFIADVSDTIDYSRHSGQRFDIVVSSVASVETVAAIQHGVWLDQFVCTDGLRFNAVLTPGNDAMAVHVDGDPNLSNPGQLFIPARIDMGGGDDVLIEGVDLAKSATVAGGVGNDRFHSTNDLNGITLRQGDTGDDYFEWSPFAFNSNIDSGAGFDTAFLLPANEDVGQSAELSGQAERYVIPSLFRDEINTGDADSVIDLSIANFPRIYGGDGNDTLIGNGGAPLYGGGGDDVFQARNGFAEYINGGDGIDRADIDPEDDVEQVELFAPPANPITPWADLPAFPAAPGQTGAIVGAPFLTGNGLLFVAARGSIEFSTRGSEFRVRSDGKLLTFPLNSVKRIFGTVTGESVINNKTRLPGTFSTGRGSDRITTGGGDSRILSGAGADTLLLSAGGKNVAFTRGFDDSVDYRDSTTHQFDVLALESYGRAQRVDVARPGGALDRIFGIDGFGVDVLLTDQPDTVDLTMFGREGYSVGVYVFMRGGNDTLASINGDYGFSEVNGGGGDDFFTDTGFEDSMTVERLGGDGDDHFEFVNFLGNPLNGGGGIDTVDVWPNNYLNPETFFLPRGAERYILRSGPSTTIVDSDDSSYIDASIAGTAFTIQGNGGDDTIIGSSADDVIDGGAGRDSLVGGFGNDRFLARDGEADILDGGDGDDSAESDSIDTLFSVETILP